MKKSINTALFTFVCFSLLSAEIGEYNYMRKIDGVTDTWHKIILPDDIYGRVMNNLNDVRIYGISETDTFEAPYIMKVLTPVTIQKDISFRLINQSHNSKGYYYTFRIPSDNTINQIDLNFSNNNYDWRVDLEGSNDQINWFTILEDYRILSIQNALTRYTFSTLKMPDSDYDYYRLMVVSDQEPAFRSATINHRSIKEGHYREYAINSGKIKNDEKYNQTVIDISLFKPVPVSFVKIFVSDDMDYYRPMNIQYLIDSVKTEKGWKYNYRTIYSGTLSSLENNTFEFINQITRKLRIAVRNFDNQPLKIDSVQVKGNVHELAVRFSQPGEYYLVYGNRRAYRPNYDIVNFQDNIPKALAGVSIGEEVIIGQGDSDLTGALFRNKLWLWLILIIIVLILGWFSLQLMKEKK